MPTRLSIRQRWRQFRTAPPGERFARFHRRQRNKHQGLAMRILLVVVGTVLVLAGLVLMPAPGPGMLVVAAGGAVLASQSALAARTMDRLELAVRRLLRRWRQRRDP